MNLKAAAELAGCSAVTMRRWLTAGKVDGAVKVQNEFGLDEWDIPRDAVINLQRKENTPATKRTEATANAVEIQSVQHEAELLRAVLVHKEAEAELIRDRFTAEVAELRSRVTDLQTTLNYERQSHEAAILALTSTMKYLPSTASDPTITEAKKPDGLLRSFFRDWWSGK